MGTVEAACATHENPPLICWKPTEAQVQFHLRRFKILINYFSIVFDAAHWWVCVLDRLLAQFSSLKVVALHRELESCTRSFVRVKRDMNLNHWAPPGNRFWDRNLWDAVYPSYPIPPEVAEDKALAREISIRHYIKEYNAHLAALANRSPDSVLLVRTETLSDRAVQQDILRFVGFEGGSIEQRMNADGTIADGIAEHFRY
jgi:hypothetical protein